MADKLGKFDGNIFRGKFEDLPSPVEEDGSFAVAIDRKNKLYLAVDGVWMDQGTVTIATWATLPAASDALYQQYRLADYNNNVVYSDGTRWRLLNGSGVWAKSAIKWLLPGLSASSTVALTANVATVTNGAAVAHNIPATTYDGSMVYFPGSANIPAGWYPGFVRTSTTAYTFQYTRSNVSSESVNGAAAYVTETFIPSIVIPGGLLGINGEVRTRAMYENNNSGNNKILRGVLNSDGMWIAPNTTNTKYNAIFGFVNDNSASKQMAAGTDYAGGVGGNNIALLRAANDTTVDSQWKLGLKCDAATDWIVLTSYVAEILTA